jgi:hypothetical protein
MTKLRYTWDPEIGNSIEFHQVFEEFNSWWNSIEFYISSGTQGTSLIYNTHPHSLCDIEFKEFGTRGIL